MSNIKYLALFLFVCLIIALCGCSAEQHLAIAKKKKPELFKADTIHIRDTTYIATSKTDTVFRQSTVKDTVVVQKDRLTMKYYYNNDSVFLSGTCSDTTIIKEIQVTTEKAIIKEGELPKWVWFALGGAFILGMLVLRFLRS